MGAGLAGGLIAGAIINGAEKAAARNAVRDPYQLISQAGCSLPLVDSHQAMVAGAMRSAQWPGQPKAGADEPRYEFSLSTSFAADFSALMTSIDARAHAADANGKASRKPTWQDSLVVVSDGLWIEPKTPADIARMVAAEQRRYQASGAEALIAKVNAAGSNASPKDRKQALSMSRKHAQNMADARDEGWSDASTAMRRAKLWSDDHCALLEKTLRSNLEHADGMLQALLGHALPAPGAMPAAPMMGTTTVPESGVPDPQAIDASTFVAGLTEATAIEPAAPVRVIEALPGGLHVSRLPSENLTLGYRHMVLDE